MILNNEFEPIRKWAKKVGIADSGDIKTQTLKLLEESGELAKAVIEEDPAKVKDSIGDCVVVLVSIAQLAGVSIEEAVNEVYYEILYRKGEMKNGTFVKKV